MRGADNSGILIAVEGIDGAGKTTQVQLLTAALREAGEPVTTSREPTDGVWGRRIKDSAKNGRLSLEDELLAFIKDRQEHVARVIGPALAAEGIVILDRYFYSTIAYQGARGADPTVLKHQMEEFAPVPDLVFILDIEARSAIERIALLRGDIPNKFEDVDSLEKARAIFNSLTAPNIRQLNGRLAPEAIHHQCLEALIFGPLRAKRCAKSYGCDNEFMCSFRFSGTCDWWNLKSKLLSRRSPGATSSNTRIGAV